LHLRLEELAYERVDDVFECSEFVWRREHARGERFAVELTVGAERA
jgi:hypothetical protein